MADFVNKYDAPLAYQRGGLRNARQAGGMHVQCLAQGVSEVVGGVLTDRVVLGTLPLDAVLLINLSDISHDAMGTGVTLSVGDATYPAALNAAAAAATAGSRKVGASVNIDKTGAPLWEMLGYASREAAYSANLKGITLYATFPAGAAVAGTVSWTILGLGA